MTNEYVECRGCEFVYVAAQKTDPHLRNWDACPNCGGTDFLFTGKSDVRLS